MKPMAWAMMPTLMLGTAPAAMAAEPKQDEKSVETPVAGSPSADVSCRVEKKEGNKGGFGGLLRAARSSGLLNAAAGRAGAGGAVTNSVANSAADIADVGGQMASAQSAQPKC